MQIISYEVRGNSLTVGFKEDNFVVYSLIYNDTSKTKAQLLQEAYQQVKHSIDYEKTQTTHSFTTNEIGEEWVPEPSKLQTLDFSVSSAYLYFDVDETEKTVIMNVATKDQYDENIDVEVALTTTLGEINNNILTIPLVQENTEIVVTAESEGIIKESAIQVFPYVEPSPSELDLLRGQIDEQQRLMAEQQRLMAEQQRIIDTMLGVSD